MAQTCNFRRRALALTAATLLAVACASLVAPQDWDSDYGPVVPHDTFPADCSLCHLGGSWNRIRADFEFDHEGETGVALLGAHAQAACLRCHNDRGPVDVFASRGCAGCHTDIHRGNLGNDCAQCHGQDTWRPNEMIARHNQTRFPLVGAHVVAACWRCHPGAQVGNFAGADVACLTCHGDDLARATQPDHMANGWTDSCESCHTSFDWRPARFPHPSSLPLTGAHGGLACTACHQPSTFVGLSPDCQACHLDDYQAATEPLHVPAGFSTDCRECHDATVWSMSRFRHPSSFPLTGGHAPPRCSACHAGGVFAGLPGACIDCHAADYQGVTSPNHVAGGFSTDCLQCHTTAGWSGAVFAHTFPITSGPHRQDCAECHRTPSNYAQFSCTHCHEHRQAEMDDEHREVAGYAWSSPACFSCHPNGRR